MEPINQLKSNVHQLTNEHTQRHQSTFQHEGHTYTEYGHGMVPALIQQLRDSTRSSMADSGGSSRGGAQLPINAAALTLYEKISDQAAREYVALARKAPRRHPEDNIRGWMSWTLNSNRLIIAAAHTTTGWIQEISGLINPPRTLEIVGHCPTCGYAKQWTQTDGELTLTSTLTATGHTATCGYCGTTWTGPELHWLKDALNTPAIGVA